MAIALFVLALPASGGNLTFTCNANVDSTHAGTCSYLNSTIAALYSSTFTNASANIYVQYGSTGLGASNQYVTYVPYSTYYTALAAHESGANDAIAVASLGEGTTNPVVAGDGVEITSALGAALGISGSSGISSTNSSACTLGSANCYNGIVTISNAANLYYRSGTESASAYDFYSVAEHEIDEILGTISCVGCSGTHTSAADLFRYKAAGTCSFSTTDSAYFSINGGITDIANYNTSGSGDYGDWNLDSLRVQNYAGFLGQSVNIGNAEISLLDAVGYNLNATSGTTVPTSTPEPGGIALIGSGLTLLAAARLLKRRK